jgi:hypothetical protein
MAEKGPLGVAVLIGVVSLTGVAGTAGALNGATAWIDKTGVLETVMRTTEDGGIGRRMRLHRGLATKKQHVGVAWTSSAIANTTVDHQNIAGGARGTIDVQIPESRRILMID